VNEKERENERGREGVRQKERERERVRERGRERERDHTRKSERRKTDRTLRSTHFYLISEAMFTDVQGIQHLQGGLCAGACVADVEERDGAGPAADSKVVWLERVEAHCAKR
jgi:hypothetical protein